MKKILFLLIFISQFTFSQNVDFDTEDYYFLKRSHHLTVSLNKGELAIENNVYEQAKFNTSNYLYFANELIHFDSFTDIEAIEAYTTTPKNNARIDVDHFETKDQFGGGVFFSDQQSISFVFPAVTKDAITTLKYKEQIKDPHFLGYFRFGTYVPTKEAIFTVEVPKNLELGYKAFNLDEFEIKLEKTETKKSTIYTWKATDVVRFRGADNSLSVLNYLPHIIVYIKNYEVKREVKHVLNNVDDLYAWYASLARQVDDSELEEVFSIADELTAGLHSEDEKAKAIFNWVQENITYVAFEDGLGGFIPRGASSVCNKRYGDCKDMANLLFEMLNHVGIDAHRTWIGTRDRPYSYYDVPTPMVDNHMITTAFINGKTIFLDATDSYVPFGMPSAFIQGKEALVGISDDEYKIIKVPEQAKEKNTAVIETTITLEDNVVKALEKRTMKGYEMVDFVYAAKFGKDDKTDEEYLNNKFEIGNNKTTYTNIDFGELTTKEGSYAVSYDLEINNYAKSIGSKIFLNLNLEKPLSKNIVQIENQKFGRKIAHKYERDYITTFIIPEGYQLKNVPDNISNELDDYGFSFEFKKEDNKLIVNRQIYMNTLAVENEGLEDYNLFIKSLIKAYKKSITLEKI